MNQEQVVRKNDLIQQAKAIPIDIRKDILMSFNETEMHDYLKAMLDIMEPNNIVEITHKAGELGKDIVMVRHDRIMTDVVAFVVKRGDIRAKTAGDVDDLKIIVKELFSKKKSLREISSQIEQALAHPAEIKSIFRELPVTKVIVVLIGDISTTVRKRITSELQTKGATDLFDINWLIDNFTEYYPQVFFEGKVIDFFQSKIQQLETKYCISKCGKNLSEYFVEPLISSTDIPIKFEEDDLPLIISRKKFPFSKLKYVLAKKRCIILIGDPGSGKSGTLAKLSIDIFTKAYQQALKKYAEKKIEIPILISARELVEIETTDELLGHYFDDFPQMPNVEITVLMVDALDEIIPDKRTEIINKAKRFCETFKCSLIITSRKIDILNNPPIGFEKYELLPFEFKQALKLFERLIGNKDHLKTLKESLERIKYQIPMMPISLILLIDLVEEKKEIPSSVTELYDRFLDIALGRWDKDKGIEVLFDYLIKKKFVASLAYHEFFEKRRLEIQKEEFKEFVNQYSAHYGCDMNTFIAEIERAGLLDIDEKVMFCHRSFLDYFSAFYIYDRREEFPNLNDIIVKLYFDELFSEVAFYYVGLMTEINETILDQIFAYDHQGLITCMDKFLSGRLLQAGWHTPTAVKFRGIEKAITFASTIKEKFLAAAENKKNAVPGIFGDFLLGTLSDFSFGSGFLFKEVTTLYDQLSKHYSKDNLYMQIILLWAIKRFLNEKELKKQVNSILEIMSKISDQLSTEDKARMLIVLMIIEDKDKSMNKIITKKVNKMKKRFPEIFKKLLPSKK